MITQFFGTEIIKKLVKSSNTAVSLPSGSVLKLGGVSSILNSTLSLDTSVIGVGGVETAILPNTLYYVYVVLDGVTEKLIASQSAIKPNFLQYRKIGAFYTDGSSSILLAYTFGSSIDFENISAPLVILDDNLTNVMSSATVAALFSCSRVGSVMHAQWTYYHQTVVGIDGAGSYGIEIPYGLTGDTTYENAGGNSQMPIGKGNSDIGGGTYRNFTAMGSNSVRVGYRLNSSVSVWGSGLNSMSTTYLGMVGNFRKSIVEWENQELDWNHY